MPAKPRWRGDRAVFADAAVVTDLTEIVDLRSGADRRHAGLRAIDARFRADLDVVAEFDGPDLRNLVQRAVEKRPAETVAADNRLRLQDHAIAEHAAVGHIGVRVQETRIAHARAGADHDARAQHGHRTDRCARADDRVRVDIHLRADSRGRIDDGRRVHERALRTRRFEHAEQSREREPRRAHGDERLLIRCRGIDEFLIDEDGAGTRCERRAEKAFVGRERQRGRVDVVRRRDPPDPHAGIANHPATGSLRDRTERSEVGVHGEGVAFSVMFRIFSTSGVMSTPP